MKNGFTLPELLATIVIIGILSSLALPVFTEHIQKAQVLEGTHLATPIKLKIIEHAHKHGLNNIQNNASLGLPKPSLLAGEYVSKITIKKGGKIEVSFNDPQGSFTLTPSIRYGIFKWQCSSNNTELNAVLPKNCSKHTPKPEVKNGE